MEKQWYQYDYSLLFGQGDPDIGGEHVIDQPPGAGTVYIMHIP